MITGRKNYVRIIFGGSTGKSCNSPGGYYITKFLGNYVLSAVIVPFVPVKIFGEIFWSPSPNLCGLGAGRGQGSGWWLGVPWRPPGPGVWKTGTWLLKQHCARERERERDGERQELGFCNSTARARDRNLASVTALPARDRDRNLALATALPAPWEGRTSGMRVGGGYRIILVIISPQRVVRGPKSKQTDENVVK